MLKPYLDGKKTRRKRAISHLRLLSDILITLGDTQATDQPPPNLPHHLPLVILPPYPIGHCILDQEQHNVPTESRNSLSRPLLTRKKTAGLVFIGGLLSTLSRDFLGS